ncbi:hypothetical protein C8J56DRAFT_934310 [Mycena floridula]|nr:hypothetical protein C8J56DRAFT_934310 [Mycena floridula]
MAHISSYYGAPSYNAGPSYSQPYQYPPFPPPVAPVLPPSVYHFDPAALSVLAHENIRFAEIVSQCLESHIRRVPSWMKLPALYLLDMISKNIFDPYARHFATFIVPLFAETYSLVEDSTRGKMEELLLTWRTGAPNGKELFGVPAQVAIERNIWGDGSSHNPVLASGQITRGQVISELEFTLGQKERALQSNPYDTTAQNHVNVLHQLRKLVESGVSQTELQQILSQLPAPSTSQWPSQPLASTYPTPAFPSVKVEPQVAPPPAIQGNINSLLSTLIKAGVVSATPPGGGTPSQATPNMEAEASRFYRHSILSHNVQLTTSGITKQRPPIDRLLYRSLALQCKQCGIRFSDSAVGKETMEEHLDMHFRQNRKANQNVGRGHSRSWFVGLEDWIHDITDVKGKGRADGTHPSNHKATAAAESAKRDAELRSQFVVCPICKEVLKSEFLEDDEDWVWKNAVKKDGKVYHATCHADALGSTSSLAARLRNELGGGQSRITPPPTGTTIKSLSPSPESKAGMKRKADDRSSLNNELDGTPPMKKLALSS